MPFTVVTRTEMMQDKPLADIIRLIIRRACLAAHINSLFALVLFGCSDPDGVNNVHVQPEDIKAFCLDVNWKAKSDPSRKAGANNFAPPGAWADLDPAEHVQWCKDLGANVIQSFAVSCNGYAWYKGGEIPPQPGLKSDFLTELVKLGHQEGMKVFGYFCVGSNTRWGKENPELSYGTPSRPHIPLTKEYNRFLGESIKEALRITGMDGFMIDWLWNPSTSGAGRDKPVKWLPCEQEMYAELMGEVFPVKENITPELRTEFGKRAIERCWEVIRAAAREVNPDCVIWLSCARLDHPEIANSRVFKEVDWLQNEAGDRETLDFVRSRIGKHTRLITTFSARFFQLNSLRAEDVAAYASAEGIGLYCYVTPKTYDYSFPPVKDYLSRPLDSFDDLDERNVAFLARWFNNKVLE